MKTSRVIESVLSKWLNKGNTQNRDNAIEQVMKTTNMSVSQWPIIGVIVKNLNSNLVDDQLFLEDIDENVVEDYFEQIDPFLTAKDLKLVTPFFSRFYEALCTGFKVAKMRVYDLMINKTADILVRIDNCDWITFTNENLPSILRLILNDNNQLWYSIINASKRDDKLTKLNTVLVANVFDSCKFTSQVNIDAVKVVFNFNGTNFIMRACDFVMLKMIAKNVSTLKYVVYDYAIKKGVKTIISINTPFKVNKLVIERVKTDGVFFDGVNWIKSLQSIAIDMPIKIENEMIEQSENIVQVVSYRFAISDDFTTEITKLRLSQIKPWSVFEQKWAMVLHAIGRGLKLNDDIIDKVINSAHKLDLNDMLLANFMEYFSCIIPFNCYNLNKHRVSLNAINQICLVRLSDGTASSIYDVRLNPNEKSFLFALALKAFHNWNGTCPIAPIQKFGMKFGHSELNKIIKQVNELTENISENQFIKASLELNSDD